MLSVLVANTKGGCGKTTVATHLAAAFAGAGYAATLADVDRQHSSLTWAKRRPDSAKAIRAVDWSKDDFTVPEGTARLVIDAPAALKMKQVEELLRLADVVVLPVLPSAFDEVATRRFLDRLDELKPIRKRRATIVVVGNRFRPRSRAAAHLDTFLAGLGHGAAARLRDSALYADAAAGGLSLFDLGGRRAAEAREDWRPLLETVEAAA